MSLVGCGRTYKILLKDFHRYTGNKIMRIKAIVAYRYRLCADIQELLQIEKTIRGIKHRYLESLNVGHSNRATELLRQLRWRCVPRMISHLKSSLVNKRHPYSAKVCKVVFSLRRSSSSTTGEAEPFDSKRR